jgi:hypothetical protein
VDTETVTVNGNGTYTTPTGFTLPTNSTATGTYQWDVTYSGDTNNAGASDVNDVNERVTVSAADPAITTTPNPTTVTQDPSSVVSGNSNSNNATSDTSDTNSASGQVTVSTTTTNPTTVTQSATAVSGNSNNAASNTNSASVQVTVSAAGAAVITTANPTTVTQSATAVTVPHTTPLSGGYLPTGSSITFAPFHGGAPMNTETVAVSDNGTDTTPTSFTLPTKHPTSSIIFMLLNSGGAPVDAETVAVSGNGTDTTPTSFTLPTGGTATGTYQRYDGYSSGDSNNAASDTNTASGQVTVMQEADLALTKQVSPPQQLEGLDVTYTFTVHNNGPSSATNVTVTDPFPGVTVVGPNTPSQGTFDPGTGVWSVGTLAPGASATLTVRARVDVLGPITSTARVSADQFDPNLSNNHSDAFLIGMSSNRGEADKHGLARVKEGAVPTAPPPGVQVCAEEASDGQPEVDALDDFTLAGEDTSLLGGAGGMLALSLLATVAASRISRSRRSTVRATSKCSPAHPRS